MAKLSLKRGEKTRLFSRRFSSVPMDYRFQASATSAEPVSGEVEVSVRRVIGRRRSRRQPLEADNCVHAGYWDTFVDIDVEAGCDLELTTPKRHMTHARLIAWLAVLVVTAALVVVLLTL